MFLFTPLLGAQSSSPAKQSLLELDNSIKILLDVGWDSSFSPSLLSALEEHAPSIDLILLSHPTLEHMGAYAHACKHIPGFNTIPVYSTFPVSNLGRLLLQDIYASTPKAYTLLGAPGVCESALLRPPTPAQIDAYCSKITTLKYSQPTPLHSAVARVAGKLGSVTITAYSAGHSLGGTIWKIQQGQESILCAVDWNLSRENCLRSAAFLSGEGGLVLEEMLKPTAMVCSTRNAMVTNIAGGRKKRDEMLIETIKKTAKEKGGTVLIPTDTAGRVLELAYVLEHVWRADPGLNGKNKGVGLYLAGRKVKRLSQVVASMLEWMDEAVVREFEAIAEASAKGQDKSRRRDKKGENGQDDGKTADSGNKAGPFDFLHLNLISTPGQLNRILNDSRGKVVIASDSSLEWGLGREALIKLASDEKNILIMTERYEGSAGLAGKIWQTWRANTGVRTGVEPPPGQITSLSLQQDIETHAKIPLQNEELIAYERHLAQQAALASQAQSALGIPTVADEDQVEDASSSSEDDSDSERQGKALTASTARASALKAGAAAPVGASEKVDIGINVLLRGDGIYDFDVRFAKGRNRMFPFQVRRRRVDEYGEVVRPDDYMRTEERAEEETADAAEEVKEQHVLGKKRKWTESSSKSTSPHYHHHHHRDAKQQSSASGINKRRSSRRKPQPQPTENADDSDSYDPDAAPLSSSSSESSESDSEHNQTPFKLSSTTHHLNIRLKATYIDFHALHDQKSLRMLLPLIQPKRLLLTAGPPEETKYLAAFYREKAALADSAAAGGTQTEVFVPRSGERIDASVDTNAWTLKLSPSLSKQLKWQNVRGMSVVHVLGRVVPSPSVSAGSEKRQKLLDGTMGSAQGQQGAAELYLDTLPPALAAATRATKRPLLVGDIRLADLRKVLQEGGHAAEFRGEGTLLVDGVVVVRKRGVGGVEIEDSGMGGKGSFGVAKRKVYEGLAVVAGG